MKHQIAVCALPRIAASLAGVINSEHSVVVVVGDASNDGVVRPMWRLIDASDHARARGVVPGQRVMDAQRFAPDLQVRVVDEQRLRHELQAVAEVLLSLSPVVEPLWARPTVAWPCHAVAVDVTGLPRPPMRLLSDIARAVATAGHRSMVALSSSKALSLAVAKDLAYRPGPRALVQVPSAAAARARLALRSLDLDVDLADSLEQTGVRTVADLCPLLAQGLVGRLGAAAKSVLPLLADDDAIDHSADNDGVVPFRPSEVVGASRDLEEPITAVEPLLFVLRPLVESIVRRLSARAERLIELSVLLGRRRHEPVVLSIAFPNATDDITVLVRVLKTRVEALFAGRIDDVEPHLLVDGFDRLTLVARRTAKAKALQLGLLHDESAGVPENIAHLLAELTAEHGANRVGVLTTTQKPLPEQMTTLSWPPAPDISSDDVPRRRRPRPVPTDVRTRRGRFMAGWPWPLRLLPRPQPLGALEVDVVERALFAHLEGGDAAGPWRRHYTVLTLRDGRRALALVDDEAGDTFLQGWFD